MTQYVYHLIDNNTGEEISASDDFSFQQPPEPRHRLNDASLREYFGSPAVVDHIEEEPDGVGKVAVHVYVDASGEVFNDDMVDPDQSYRRS